MICFWPRLLVCSYFVVVFDLLCCAIQDFTPRLVILAEPGLLRIEIGNTTERCKTFAEFNHVFEGKFVTSESKVEIVVPSEGFDHYKGMITFDHCFGDEQTFNHLTLSEFDYRCVHSSPAVFGGFGEVLRRICLSNSRSRNYSPSLCEETCDWLVLNLSFNCSLANVTVDEDCNSLRVNDELSADELIFTAYLNSSENINCVNWSDEKLTGARSYYEVLLPYVDNNYCYLLPSMSNYYCIDNKTNELANCLTHTFMRPPDGLVQEERPNEGDVPKSGWSFVNSVKSSVHLLIVPLIVLLWIVSVVVLVIFVMWLRKKSSFRAQSLVRDDSNVITMRRIDTSSSYFSGSDNRMRRREQTASLRSRETMSTCCESLYAYLGPIFEVAAKNVRIVKELDRGAYGCVFLAVLTTSGDHIAVKTVNEEGRLDGRGSEGRGVDSEYKLKKEAHVLCQLNHPHVLKFMGVVSLNTKSFQLLVEYISGGNMLNFLRLCANNTSAQPVSLYTLLSFAQQVWQGMQYLSEKLIVHRDLAARNCLLTEARIVKISDFGFAEQLVSPEDFLKINDDSDLPVRWLPPETLMQNLYFLKSDVWQFGVLMWEIFSLGMKPYFELNLVEVIGFVSEGNVLPKQCGVVEYLDCFGSDHVMKKEYPDSVYSFMKKCWSYEANDRPSFSSNKETDQLFELAETIRHYYSYQNVDPKC